jgi:RimJ/RimL family protein N-acetyltransferase
VRLYDFQDDSFCWGSWILDRNKSRYAAIESAILVYDIGFDCLGFSRSHFDIRKENKRVIHFHERFGAKMIGEDEFNVYFNLSQPDYLGRRYAMLDVTKSVGADW